MTNQEAVDTALRLANNYNNLEKFEVSNTELALIQLAYLVSGIVGVANITDEDKQSLLQVLQDH